MSSGLELVPVTSQKHDPAWKHCQMFKHGDRILLKCIYCCKIFKGGGIHRIKEHLAGQKGNAASCLRVHPDVRILMQESLDGAVVRKRKKQKLPEEIEHHNNFITCDGNDFIDPGDVDVGFNSIEVSPGFDHHSALMFNQVEPSSKKIEGRRKRGKLRHAFGASHDPLNPGLIQEPAHIAIGRFFHETGLSPEAVNSAYFQPMVDAIASQGLALVPPNETLKKLLHEVKSDVDQQEKTWSRTGCSILVDEFESIKERTFLSFWVYSPVGMIFLKSTDISNSKNSPDSLYELIKQVVEQVGVKNVLQVITNNEEKYVVAGNRLTDTFPNLYCSPDAASCLDLILEDLSRVEWINPILKQAKSITRSIYNNSDVLSMMRHYTSGFDLVVPGVTCAATNFTMVRRILDLKQSLQTMISSQEWMDCSYSKKPSGLMLLELISGEGFWHSIHQIVRITRPLLRILALIQSRTRPGLGYVYAGIYWAKEVIKKELVKRKDYSIFWNIIDSRWKSLRRFPLHTAGFYLNPEFFYRIDGEIHNEVVSGMFDCIEKLVPEIKVQDKIIKEISFYKNATGDFGRKMAVRARDSLLPAEWWSTYGGGCPNLARLAIRILSQTCSLLGCKRNERLLERLHGMRNRLEHSRLSDLVFVHYNLQLRTEKNKRQVMVDPGVVEDWIVDDNLELEEQAGGLDWTTVSVDFASRLFADSGEDDDLDTDIDFHDGEIFDMMKEDDEEIIEHDQ